MRKKLNLTQEEFAARFHLPLGTVRDWEQGAHRPDQAARVLLTVIEKDPDGVVRALERVAPRDDVPVGVMEGIAVVTAGKAADLAKVSFCKIGQ